MFDKLMLYPPKSKEPKCVLLVWPEMLGDKVDITWWTLVMHSTDFAQSQKKYYMDPPPTLCISVHWSVFRLLGFCGGKWEKEESEWNSLQLCRLSTSRDDNNPSKLSD